LDSIVRKPVIWIYNYSNNNNLPEIYIVIFDIYKKQTADIYLFELYNIYTEYILNIYYFYRI